MCRQDGKSDPQLGSWVVKQRYRRKKGLLKNERIRKLDEVVMVMRRRGYMTLRISKHLP